MAPWLALVGWVTWNAFGPVADWIGEQNEFLQELLWLVCVLAWALFLGLGAGAAVMLAEHAAGPEPYRPGNVHGQHARWRRPDRS